MAFEIYYRKDKPLLMLQSVKKAWRLAPEHPQLHTCLVRFTRLVNERRDQFAPAVRQVILAEMEPMVGSRSALELAEEFAAGPAKTSQAAALAAARVLCMLQPERAHQAIQLATALHYPDVTLEGCVEVLESLREGELGECEKETETYISACTSRYPYALAFKPPAPAPDTAPSTGDPEPLKAKEVEAN